MSQSARPADSATAWAGINIALGKYWGKRDTTRNLPAVSSLSLTLAEMGTRTTVIFDPELTHDVFELDGVEGEDPRVVAMLDGIRGLRRVERHARVISRNHVPTASGLASSASGAAALAAAAWAATGGDLAAARADRAFIELVRRGSGSAPRSLYGGLVELDRDSGGVRPVLSANAWDLRMVVARLAHAPKKISSRQGMARTASTSPFYGAWVDAHPGDMVAARAAIEARDLPALGAVMERSTYRMHAAMLGADPPLRYWNGRTLDALDRVEALRAAGVGAWATMDAGPHVKVLCVAADAEAVAAALAEVAAPGDVTVARAGPGATIEP